MAEKDNSTRIVLEQPPEKWPRPWRSLRIRLKSPPPQVEEKITAMIQRAVAEEKN